MSRKIESGENSYTTNWCYFCKLNIDKVKEIKLLLKANQLTQKEISEKYHVSQVIINHINTGRRWSHVII